MSDDKDAGWFDRIRAQDAILLARRTVDDPETFASATPEHRIVCKTILTVLANQLEAAIAIIDEVPHDTLCNLLRPSVPDGDAPDPRPPGGRKQRTE